MFDIVIMSGKIRLGKQGEHLARRVPFELGLWENQFGEGRCELLHQRNGDEAPYPVNLTVDNNVAYWNVTSVDTAVAGKGECELRYIVNDVVVKSTTYVTKVSESLGEGTEEPPEGAKPWVDEVLNAAQKVEDATTHQPIIGDNGNWFTWDAENNTYVDTGVTAKGSVEYHTHDVAHTVYNGKVSLIGITTGGSGSVMNSITDTTITESIQGTYHINVKGDVTFNIRSTAVACTVLVDGNVIAEGGTARASWGGKVEQGIEVVLEDGYIRFGNFTLTEHVNGFMTWEQSKKLDSTEIFTAEEKAKLESINPGEPSEPVVGNVYTQEESDLLVKASSIEYKRKCSLEGDELEGKKDSNNIHLMSVTNQGAVVFNEEYTHNGRYFGYVGVKNVTSGKHVLVAEIDINTDFDMSKARVQTYYQETVGGSSKPEGVVVGVPKNGKNIIIYTFEASADKPVRGFYFDAQGTNKPTVGLTLRDVKLYTPVVCDFVINDDRIKDWKTQIYNGDKAVVSELGEYGILSTSDSMLITSFKTDMNVDVLLYIDNDDAFASKEDVEILSNVVSELNTSVKNKADASELILLGDVVAQKGVTFMQYSAGVKIPLEKDCLYYLRCNSDTIYYYKNGSKLSQYTSGFGDGLVMMASNIFQGSHINFFAAPSSGFMDFSMNGYTISTKDTDDVYAMSNSDVVNVWKLKA